jgi:hypothetical protein
MPARIWRVSGILDTTREGGEACGFSNSPHAATSGRVVEAGIDTARILFRVRDERDQHRLDGLAAGAPVLSGEFAGLRVGWMPAHELVWLEGRPAKPLGLGDGLLPPEALCEGVECSLGVLREVAGIARPREVGVSRLDATATIALDRPSEGWALLRGMAALEMPRRKTALFLEHGRPQTVARITPAGRVCERIYDKGAQLGSDAPGLRIRFEAQTRWPARGRDVMGDWHSERVRDEFERRFRPMATAADGLHVASESVIRELVKEHVDAGAINGRMAELLLGHLAAETVGICRPLRTVRRRRADLRRLGLAQALDGADPVDVPLDDVLGELLSANWTG